MLTAATRRWWWRRGRRRRDLARAEIRRLPKNLESVEFASVGRRPERLRAVRGLRRRAEAAMSEIGAVETGHAAVLAVMAHRIGLIIGDVGRRYAAKVFDQRVPVLDQRAEFGARQQERAGAVGDLDDAEVIDHLGAVRTLDDGRGAAADADGG